MTTRDGLELRRVHGETDLAAFLYVHNAVAPELALDPDEARYAERLDPTLCRLVAERDGEVVGAALVGRHLYFPPDADVLLAGIWVLPETRQRGVGGALLDEVVAEARRRGRGELEGPSTDADPAGQAFLKRRGFVERDRSRYVALDVEHAAVEAPRPPAGVTLTSLADRPDLAEAVYAVAREAIPDVPEEEPMSAGSYEEWRAFWIDPPSVSPGTVFLATAGDEVAGYSTLALPRARPRVGVHTMTGVARAWRGQGIASALKRHAIVWAAAHSLRSLEAENVEANTAIRSLNEVLGYRPLADHVWLHGRIGDAPAQTGRP